MVIFERISSINREWKSQPPLSQKSFQPTFVSEPTRMVNTQTSSQQAPETAQSSVDGFIIRRIEWRKIALASSIVLPACVVSFTSSCSEVTHCTQKGNGTGDKGGLHPSASVAPYFPQTAPLESQQGSTDFSTLLTHKSVFPHPLPLLEERWNTRKNSKYNPP